MRFIDLIDNTLRKVDEILINNNIINVIKLIYIAATIDEEIITISF
jgi:hypothetical protein